MAEEIAGMRLDVQGSGEDDLAQPDRAYRGPGAGQGSPGLVVKT